MDGVSNRSRRGHDRSPECLSLRRRRCGMGVPRSLPDADDRGRSVVEGPDAEPVQRHPINAIRYAVRYVVRGGIPWRMMPKDFPPRSVVYQQARRWQRARVFEPIAHELRLLERVLQDRPAEPAAVVPDGRVLRSTPESGHPASYDGYRRTGLVFWRPEGPHRRGYAGKPTCSRSSSAERRHESGIRWPACVLNSRKSLAARSNWPMSIRDTPARTPNERPRRSTSNWRS